MKNASENISFTKMAGTGNDFIVFDNRTRRFSGNEEALFSRICRRRLSVGADGVILVEKSHSADVRMRYFNADGRESAMCGNGARCTAFYARAKGIVRENRFTIQAGDGLHSADVHDNGANVSMGTPENFRSDLGILREADFREGGFLTIGVPHFVVFVPDADAVDVEALGAHYRSHPVFPEGTNVNFVQTMGENRIRVRTFERGVEGETLSCGTGCAASALVSAKVFGYASPVHVDTHGGKLDVWFDEAGNDIRLSGPVKIVYEGVLIIDDPHLLEQT